MTCSQSEHILARLGHRYDLTMTRMPLSRQTTTELIWLHLFINNNHRQTHDRSLCQSRSCVLPNSAKITYLTRLQVYVVIESLLLIDRTYCRNECHMVILFQIDHAIATGMRLPLIPYCRLLPRSYIHTCKLLQNVAS